ncbi:hypothetical protein AB0C07_14980 [Actinoplanes missouriensis]
MIGAVLGVAEASAAGAPGDPDGRPGPGRHITVATWGVTGPD